MAYIKYDKKLFFNQLTQVADYLEANPNLPFDMGSFHNCILGYADKLGFTQITCSEELPKNTYEYLFSHDWKYKDNTLLGAVERIRLFVKNCSVSKSLYKS